MTDTVKINRGLKGIYFERSGVSHIDGAKGELLYRGYSIHDLAGRASFEEVCHLLVHGELPNSVDLQSFDATLRANRRVPDAVLDVIRTCKGGHPMDVLRTAVSALAALDPDSGDASEAGFLNNGIALTAQLPTLIAAHHRIRQGLDPVAPQTRTWATRPTGSGCSKAKCRPRTRPGWPISTSSFTRSTGPTPRPSPPASPSAPRRTSTAPWSRRSRRSPVRRMEAPRRT